MKRMNGVMLDGRHSYYDYGFYMADRPSIESPSPKTITVAIPGANGELDLTESTTGEVKYDNRTIKLSFSKMVDIFDQADAKSLIMDALHGKIVSVVLDEDPDWVYRGRATVKFSKVGSWRLRADVEIDAEPYKTALHDTSVSFADSDSVPADEFTLTDNKSTVPYRTVFQFYGGEDFRAFDSIKISWNPDTSTTWGTSHEIKFIDATGASHSESVTFANGYAEFSNSAMYNWTNVDISDIVQIEIDNIGGGWITAGIDDASVFPVYNERMSVAPRWMVSGSSAISAWVNGRQISVPAGDSRLPSVMLKAGKNEIVLFDSVADNVSIVFRKGRL